MAYQLLSEPIRKFIRKKKWESLRPIQAAAISRIIQTNYNYILASKTASGKTEAAFLPILSKVDFNEPGVQVLYISPLIALINDQFKRIEELCKDLEISVVKWHGEAKRSQKKALIKTPRGIVLITPESIEAMFVNAPYNVSSLFGSLKFIVIDEIHSFLGTDRGIQLMSLLSRLQEKSKSKIVIIGLSATIGAENYMAAKKFTGDEQTTKILVDKGKKETLAKFKYFELEAEGLSHDLLKDLYLETSNSKSLIFPNSRGRTEEIAVKLRKLSDHLNGHKNYFSHHSSVDKEIREHVEHFAKNNERFNFCISCTSTLELGIDIGSVDKIVQIDSTHSVSSLIQRIGRSGRREGASSAVDIYATNKWSFLQALASWNLYKSDFIEPVNNASAPYDILLHQMLSIVKQFSGCRKVDLIKRLRSNIAFQNIEKSIITEIIDFSITKGFLELIQREIILGIEGEQIVNSREFYSVFKTEMNYKVIHAGRKIGDIPFSHQVRIDENLFLAAKIWKIKDIDEKAFKIIVIPANDGKKPIFGGGKGNIHSRIREEMLRILKSDTQYEELNDKCNEILNELRFEFERFSIENIQFDRPCIQKNKVITIYTFSGSKINRSLGFLFGLVEIQVQHKEQKSSIDIVLDHRNFKEIVIQINESYLTIDSYLSQIVEENEGLVGFSKWAKYLPLKYKCEILKDRYFDFKSSLSLLNNINLIYEK